MECPLCNGLTFITHQCKNCYINMDDFGKVMDYYDDYSAYLETDIQKQTDGDPQSVEQHVCQHLLSCSQCGSDEVVAIYEVNI
jgi:hypothetical protein